MTGAPLDDEDDDPRARPALTHARGKDVFAEHMRKALQSVQAAKFSGTTPKERAAAEHVEDALLSAFADLGLTLYG